MKPISVAVVRSWARKRKALFKRLYRRSSCGDFLVAQIRSSLLPRDQETASKSHLLSLSHSLSLHKTRANVKSGTLKACPIANSTTAGRSTTNPRKSHPTKKSQHTRAVRTEDSRRWPCEHTASRPSQPQTVKRAAEGPSLSSGPLDSSTSSLAPNR